MTVDLRGAAYAASRISSTLKGSTKQFGWLQAPATILVIHKAGILDSGLLLAIAAGLFIGPHTVHGNRPPLRLSRVAPVPNRASNSDHRTPLERLLVTRRSNRFLVSSAIP